MSQFKKFWAEIATIVGAVLLTYQLAQAFAGNRSLVTGLLILASLIVIGIAVWNYAFTKSIIPEIPRYKYHLFAKFGLFIIAPSILFSAVYTLTILDIVSDCCGFVPTRTSAPTLTSTASDTSTPTPTSTSTLSPTPTTISNATYFMIVLDASAEMTQEFDNTTKWAAALESVNGIIDGLDPLANYGLIVIGSEPVAGGANPCNEPSSLRSPFTNREKVKEQIGQLQPAGGGSLYTAFNLANNQFRNLPPGAIGTLIYVTSATDICDQDEWDQLEKLFEIPGPGGVVALLYSEIIIIENDKDIRRTIQEQMASVSQNLVVQAPPGFTYIQDITNNTVINHVENHIDIIVTNIPPTNTATRTPTLNIPSPPVGNTTVAPPMTLTPSHTPSLAPTWTPSVTPSPTFTPSLSPTPPPSVVLTGFEYVGTGESCQALIYFQVSGSPAIGHFRVWNQWYTDNGMLYDPNYPQVTLPVGPNGYQVGLGGNGNPAYYRHEVWFEYNVEDSTTNSNRLYLICPGLTPSP